MKFSNVLISFQITRTNLSVFVTRDILSCFHFVSLKHFRASLIKVGNE